MKRINYKQTLKHLSNNIAPVFKGSLQWQQTIDLFDKAIPKKTKQTKISNGYTFYHCPECGYEVGDIENFNYCKQCGQAINRGNDE